jgi:3-hydroxyisobutyrate dehydrogenase-like beta-hydroxyacid dehydrogenase
MSRRARKNVGIIGLGIIGSRIREVLRRKGFHVFVWNRTPRTVPNFVGAPAELAEMCDNLAIYVSDDDALDYVVKQLSPALTARHLVIAHSTVAPHSMVAAAEIIERRGARFVEAPFTGSKEAAEKGELVYYLGGKEEALKAARPILEATGKHLLEIGDVGSATAIKLATNMITAATVQAAAEAMALVHASGVPIEKFVSALHGNASNSITLNMKVPKMVERKFDPHFSVKHMLKDVQLASRLGLTHHLELGVTTAARDRLLEQMQNGRGDEDYSAVVRKYFPDQPPPKENQEDLELFNAPHQQSQPVPFMIMPDAIPTEPLQSVEPMSPAPSAAPVPEDLPQHIVPESFPALQPAAENPVEQQNGNVLVEEEQSAPEEDLSASSSEEESAPRSFFSRLLRR